MRNQQDSLCMRKEALTDTERVRAFIWDFLVSKMVRNKCLSLKPPKTTFVLEAQMG